MKSLPTPVSYIQRWCSTRA